MQWVNDLPAKPKVICIPETGHFFHKRLNDLRDVIEDAIENDMREAVAMSAW
jgi:alpha/beta superfamily hydrolase